MAQATDSVHFGSIVFEDNKVDNSLENKDKINVLTQDSKQQKTFENLHPELKVENDRTRDLQNRSLQPHFNNNSIYLEQQKNNVPPPSKNQNTVGVVKNKDLDPKVIYFIEHRPIHGNSPKDIFLDPNTYRTGVGRVHPGEMIKVVDSSSDYIQKMRMDRDNQGLWRQVGRRESGDPSDLYVYYDWKNFETIPATVSAIDLDILVPQNMGSIPVFSRPGSWTWKDCQLGSDVCVDRIDQHVNALLLDTSFSVVSDLRSRKDILQLYYKIGYKLTDKAGNTRTRIGWIPAYQARRKISSVPRSVLSINGQNSNFETDEERSNRLSKHYVFEKNINSENIIFNRWLTKKPGESEEIYDNTFSFDALMAYSTFNLKQSFLDDPFKQTSAMFGIGMYAPIYVDLELQGTLMYSVPVTHAPENLYTDTPLFRGDQWLTYTTPIGLDKMPIKVSLGMYYLSMFESQSDFGFKSFVGFQAKIGVETRHFWLDARIGPTGQDFDFNMTNREVGGSFGLRLNPSKGYDSLTLFLDYSQTSYTSPVSEHTTEFNILNIGFRKTFR